MHNKVLLVENNDDTREYMKILLELSDYEVLEATNGKEAVNLAQTNFLDLVLMDILLPEMDGLAATKLIRKSEESTHIPIIAVTAFGQFFQKPALAAGCNDLITKPINFGRFDAILKKYLPLEK